MSLLTPSDQGPSGNRSKGGPLLDAFQALQWRPRWQGLVRLGLAVGLIWFGVSLFLGVGERAAPEGSRGIPRSDPEAVIEITDAELTQTAGELENYRLSAARQLVYDDGSNRFTDGFRLEVTERVDRDSFVVTGTEAMTDDAEGDITAIGGVRLVVSDGLGAQTERATYARGRGIVDMPGPTRLTRDGMEATGQGVVYERDRSFVTLGEMAHVRLTGDETRAALDIRSSRAILAHTDGYMYFDGGTEISTGAKRLDATEATAKFGDDETALERLELSRNAHIHSGEAIPGGLQEMTADEMTLDFEVAARVLERAQLSGDARIHSAEPISGGLRQMCANLMVLDFEEAQDALERAQLEGGAGIELVGSNGNPGASIRASTMDVVLAPDGGDVGSLVARNGVALQLPVTSDGMQSEIRSSTLTSQSPSFAARNPPPATEVEVPAIDPIASNGGGATCLLTSDVLAARVMAAAAIAQAAIDSADDTADARPDTDIADAPLEPIRNGEVAVQPPATSEDAQPPATNSAPPPAVLDPSSENGLSVVEFSGRVEYRESLPVADARTNPTRVISADRLTAGAEPGLSALLTARFLGNVQFQEEGRTASADDVAYDVSAGLVTLIAVEETGRNPMLVDGDSTIEASSITLSLNESAIDASGDVRSEIFPSPNDGESLAESTMPALLDADERVFVTATNLRYDPDTGLAAYTGGARLWQGDTSFSGDTIALDGHTGGLAVEGDVRTRIQLVRVTETGEQPQNSLTTAEASTFLYDDSGRHALYEESATLLSDAGDLKADRIDVFLESDGRTLDRLEATGNVKIRLDGRWAIGESLVYREAEGRYEMEGAPVEIVEEVEPSETPVAVSPPRENTLPAPPSCNTTKGRSLTFYRSNDTISVDGREEYRTQSNSGVCNPLVF